MDSAHEQWLAVDTTNWLSDEQASSHERLEHLFVEDARELGEDHHAVESVELIARHRDVSLTDKGLLKQRALCHVGHLL